MFVQFHGTVPCSAGIGGVSFRRTASPGAPQHRRLFCRFLLLTEKILDAEGQNVIKYFLQN